MQKEVAFNVAKLCTDKMLKLKIRKDLSVNRVIGIDVWSGSWSR